MKTELILAFTMGLVIILFKKIKMLKYYAKFLFFLFFSLISATIFMPLMFLKPGDYRNGLLPAWGARKISKALGLQWNMQGKHNIIQDTGTVILINHQSVLDLLVLAEIWPVFERSTVIAKREIFYLWPFGLAAWMWGTVFINRSNKKGAQASVNQVATTINSKKAKICMFPEGTRHDGPKLLPFKKGAFHIAISSQAPIQPIVVSRYKFIDHETFRFDAGSSTIQILPAIHTAGLKLEDINELIKKTHNAMAKEYQIINQKV